MPKPLSLETIERIKLLYCDGWSSEMIGREINSKPSTITKYLRAAGITIRGQKKKLTEDDRATALQLYRDGYSATAVSKQLNTSVTSILRLLDKEEIQHRQYRRYRISEDFFDSIDTEEKAYMLGFLFADGANIQQANFVRIDLNVRDQEILDQFAKLILH